MATPTSVPTTNGDTAALRQLISNRRSCRAYRADPVPHAIIAQIVELAAQSPSWCNTQPWQLVVTEGTATEAFRTELSAHAQSSPAPSPDFAFPERYSGVYNARRREVGWQLYESVGIVRGDREASARQASRNFELFGAPHVALVTTDAELGVYGVLDCGLFVSAFLLAAESLGVGAIAQAAIASYPQLVRDHFGLPSSRLVVCGISFGWPDTTHPANSFRTSRAATDDLVSWVGDDTDFERTP